MIAPKDPGLAGIISPRDLNCAVSAPNALVGSRSYGKEEAASFRIANGSSITTKHPRQSFALISFYIKPLDAPPMDITVSVIGYSYAQDKPLQWHVDFPAGYHLPFLVKMREYSRDQWEYLYAVEVSAEFSVDKLDWEFCVDDLEVHFQNYTEKDSTVSDQVILRTGGICEAGSPTFKGPSDRYKQKVG